MKHYHVTLIGYEKKIDAANFDGIVEIALLDVDILRALKRAKELYPKKHWMVRKISECYHHCLNPDELKRAAEAMEKMVKDEQKHKKRQ